MNTATRQAPVYGGYTIAKTTRGAYVFEWLMTSDAPISEPQAREGQRMAGYPPQGYGFGKLRLSKDSAGTVYYARWESGTNCD